MYRKVQQIRFPRAVAAGELRDGLGLDACARPAQAAPCRSDGVEEFLGRVHCRGEFLELWRGRGVVLLPAESPAAARIGHSRAGLPDKKGL